MKKSRQYMIHGKHDLLEIALKSFQVGRGGMWVYYKSSLKKKKKKTKSLKNKNKQLFNFKK